MEDFFDADGFEKRRPASRIEDLTEIAKAAGYAMASEYPLDEAPKAAPKAATSASGRTFRKLADSVASSVTGAFYGPRAA